MNCMSFRKFVGAFADGELGIEKNLDALEHLNMCPVCAERVSEVQHLRAALQRIHPSVPAPQALRDRISAALDQAVLEGSGAQRALSTQTTPERGPATKSGGDVASASQAKPGLSHPVAARMKALLAMAAVVIFCIGIFEFFSGPSQAPFPLNTVEANTVAAARTQHAQCSGRGIGHHDPSLPRDLQGAAKILSERMGLAVKAPDLASLGFEFVGAGGCGLSGTPGVHVLYKSEKYGSMFSLFTVARIEGIHVENGSPTRPRGCFVEMGRPEAAVVVWHEGKQSYVGCACGNIPRSVLDALIEAVQAD